MKKKDIKAEINKQIADKNKNDIYSYLVERNAKKFYVARLLASYPNEKRVYLNNGRINILITIMFVMALMMLFLGLDIGSEFNNPWIFSVILAAIPLLFAWGFFRNSAFAYNAYIILTIIQLPQSFRGFSDDPVANTIAITINLSILAYVWYLRNKLFPDFFFINPRKENGEYVFSD